MFKYVVVCDLILQTVTIQNTNSSLVIFKSDMTKRVMYSSVSETLIQ